VRRLSPIAALLVCLISLGARGQGPPALDTFNSPDGSFQFIYPENYELLVGERILKATQGRQAALPVCDFSIAVACVIYPIEGEGESKLEAAGFSVAMLPGTLNETDCLGFSDPLSRARGATLTSTSVPIHSRMFRHASAAKRLPGHFQSGDYYRVYAQQRCYELQVEVSMSEDGVPAPKAPRSATLVDPRANKARESLQLILASVTFGKE